MKKELLVLLFMWSAVMLSGCSRPTDSDTGSTGADNHSVASPDPLAGVAEAVVNSGELIPANRDMVRLMKLPITSADGSYYCHQLIMKPQPDDVRGMYVGGKDKENIILARVNTRRDSFERYSYLTSPRGDLRCIVHSSSGSREQQIIAPTNPDYEKAAKDFADQVKYWCGLERELRAMSHKN